MTGLITLHLTPAEHAFLLLKLGRGTGSTIRPGESLSAEEVLVLTDKMVASVERQPLSKEIAALRFLAQNLRLSEGDAFEDFKVLAHERNELADRLIRVSDKAVAAKRDAALSELAELDAPYL